jgi:hypothetical protein
VRWFLVAAAAEPATTGLFLIIAPMLFGWLILGAELSEPGQALGRLAGITLIAFALGCWPTAAPSSYPASSFRALLIYNLVATLYLLYLGIGGNLVGILLWPAVALHAVLAILVSCAWLAASGR